MSSNELKENKRKNSLNLFDKIKSPIILKKILGNVYKKVSYGIIKYNKMYQNKLDLTLEDYKEANKIYSTIIVEIKPVKDKFGTFIKIQNEKEKNYYHIFFNDSKVEIKRRFIKENEVISKITIAIDFNILSLEKLFYNCECIESINFTKFYRHNIIDMSYMFCGCKLLKEINFSNFITDNVTEMCSMFSGCYSLEELNVSNFNTSNVTDMTFMFSDCASLKELDLSNFNTDNVEQMGYMFFNCESLEKLNISNFNTNNVLNMDCMLVGLSYELKMEIKNQNENISEEAYIIKEELY